MSIKIRSEVHSNIASVEALTASTFLDAPHTSHTEQFIVNALRKAGQLVISLVAEESGKIVGHVAALPMSIHRPGTSSAC